MAPVTVVSRPSPVMNLEQLFLVMKYFILWRKKTLYEATFLLGDMFAADTQTQVAPV